MKKKFIIISIVLIVIIAFIYFKYIFGWLEFRSNNYTPKEYKSIVHVSKEQYSKDSLNLISIIRNKIEKHQDPYNSFVPIDNKKVYTLNNFTKIYIDSILYSPKLDRIVFLVIIKNENRNIYKGLSEKDSITLASLSYVPYGYNEYSGRSFIALKAKNVLSDFDYFSYPFTNGENYSEIAKNIRMNCFNLTKDDNTKRTYYNVDDIRFWESDIWNNKL